jgi:hypothetical protein
MITLSSTANFEDVDKVLKNRSLQTCQPFRIDYGNGERVMVFLINYHYSELDYISIQKIDGEKKPKVEKITLICSINGYECEYSFIDQKCPYGNLLALCSLFD